MCQYRSGLTFTPYIQQRELEDTAANWKKLIDAPVDPVSAIMVGPNPNAAQLRRVLAKAVVSGPITTRNNHYLLRSYGDDTVDLGDRAESVIQTLGRRFRGIVFIESTFARDLVVKSPAGTRPKTWFILPTEERHSARTARA